MGLSIRLDDLSGPEITALLTEHRRHLAEITEACSMHALDLSGLCRPEVTLWSVWNGNDLAGCGALKELDATHAEVKSMRTAQAHLRQGVASAVLQHIIAEAKRRGYRRLSLETGSSEYFEPARRLYAKFGFAPCGPFIGYGDDPNSFFMTMELA